MCLGRWAQNELKAGAPTKQQQAIVPICSRVHVSNAMFFGISFELLIDVKVAAATLGADQVSCIVMRSNWGYFSKQTVEPNQQKT